MERAERDVVALGREREPDRDVDPPEADGAVPNGPHRGKSNTSRWGAFLLAYDGLVATASPTFVTELTTPSLWRHALDKGKTTPAYLEEQPDGWREVSWSEAAERVDALGRALLARGVRHGDSVAVLSRTRLEWLLLDWAIMSIGAVVVGLYPTNTATECKYILEHSEAVLAFAEDEAQYAKLASVHSGPIVRFAEIPQLEAEAGDLRPDPVAEDDLATLIYTSGTT